MKLLKKERKDFANNLLRAHKSGWINTEYALELITMAYKNDAHLYMAVSKLLDHIEKGIAEDIK